jgi:deoxycytidine triphosphate deaminase/addiction module HigA family antidote
MSAGGRSKAGVNLASGQMTPGAHLRAVLGRLGLDQVAVSEAAGVSRQTINNIINGRQAISRAMAGKLGRLTGHSSDYWLSEWFSAKGAPAQLAVSGLLVDHQIARAIKDGIISIKPYRPQNLQAAAIALTLSASIVLGGKPIAIARKRGFCLEPGHAVSASTAETVALPRDYLGRLGAVSGLASHGVIAAHAFQIEPGFSGRLKFNLFNAGIGPVALRAHEPVVALELIRLSAAPERRVSP